MTGRVQTPPTLAYSAQSQPTESKESAPAPGKNSGHTQDSGNAEDSPDTSDSDDKGDSDNAEDSAVTEDSDGAGGCDDAGDSAIAEDADHAEDSADAENSADAQDGAGSAEPASVKACAAAANKTPLRRLLALAEKSCGLLTRPRELINASVARAVAAGSAGGPPQPAATVAVLAIGLPHAHPAHPPGIPLPPLGPVLVGFSNDVLINGAPAVLSGALGVSPTCCGLSPFYEVFTGSAKVLINGEHAARAFDLTFHCQAAPAPARRTGAALRRLRQGLQATEQGLQIMHKVEDCADYAEQSAEAFSAVRSAEQGSPEHRAATEAVSMAMTSRMAERAQDALSDAISRLMGRDAAAPAGTPGVLIGGAANVLLGGLSVPNGSFLVRGLLRLVPARCLQSAGKRT